MSGALHKCLTGLCLLSAISCSHKVVINSEPAGFEVYAGTSMLGRTPVSITTDDIKSSRDINGFYLIRLNKTGYEAISVVIPRAHSNLTLDLNLRNFAVKAEKLEQSSEPDPATMRRYYIDSATVLNQQMLVLNGNSPDSEAMDQIKEKYPDSSTPLFLTGLNQIIQGKKSEAKKTLSEALSRNPQDDDAQALYIGLTSVEVKE